MSRIIIVYTHVFVLYVLVRLYYAVSSPATAGSVPAAVRETNLSFFGNLGLPSRMRWPLGARICVQFFHALVARLSECTRANQNVALIL